MHMSKICKNLFSALNEIRIHKNLSLQNPQNWQSKNLNSMKISCPMVVSKPLIILGQNRSKHLPHFMVIGDLH